MQYTRIAKKKDDISAYPWIDKTFGYEKRVEVRQKCSHMFPFDCMPRDFAPRLTDLKYEI